MALSPTSSRSSGGSAAPTTRAIYGGNNVSIPNTGAAVSLTWDSLLEGTALLSLTAPALPTIVTAGVYAVAVQTYPQSSMTDGKAYQLSLTVNGGQTDVIVVRETRAVEDAFDFDTYGYLAVTFYLATGSFLSLKVQQADAGAINFNLATAVIQRIS